MKYKKYNLDSYDIYTIQTDKFKNCYIEVRFREDVRNINLSRRNLLAAAMQYTSLKYPTKREMIIALEELYNSAVALAAAINYYIGGDYEE